MQLTMNPRINQHYDRYALRKNVEYSKYISNLNTSNTHASLCVIHIKDELPFT